MVFPDRLAEMPEQALTNRAAEVLSEPQRLMTELVDTLRHAQ
jgi:hypothetical protein